MSTVTLKKTPVTTKWNLEKVQEETARVLSMNMMTAMNILAKHGEQAVNEFDTAMRERKVQHYKSLGVKTPLELVTAMAEFEHNVFGSKIEIGGDDKVAQLTYQACGMWNAMQKYGNMTPQQEEKMGGHFENCVKNLAKEFGFTAEVKMEEPCCTITFTK